MGNRALSIALLAALAFLLLATSCQSTAPQAQFMEVMGTEDLERRLIKSPETVGDLAQNCLIFEYMWMQEKVSRLSLQEYLARLSGDEERAEEIRAELSSIESRYSGAADGEPS